MLFASREVRIITSMQQSPNLPGYLNNIKFKTQKIFFLIFAYELFSCNGNHRSCLS